MKRALIVGGHGQDGQLLQIRLQSEGTIVTVLGRGDVVVDEFEAVLAHVASAPDEIYYLAAYHHSSQDAMELNELDLYRRSRSVHVDGLMNFLEAIRQSAPQTRLFYAASSLIFGTSASEMQNELTAINPRCFYGITKAAGLQCCRLYREKHGVFAVGGILFNHESPLRQPKFVIPKIVRAAVAIARGSEERLRLGDLAARVDWGYAPDYVDAMSRILRLPSPDDFVIATGETHSVQSAVEMVFKHLGLDWREHVEESPNVLTRNRAVLCGDARKLRIATGWAPSMSFPEMLKLLLNAQLHG